MSKSNFIIVFTTCMVITLINLDYTAVVIALPTISKELHTAMINSQWLISSFGIATCCFLVLATIAIQRFGSWSVFMAGLLTFLLASAISSYAHSITVLILGRVLQGLGSAATLPTSVSLITATFTGAKKQKAIGLVSSMVGLSQLGGPMIGSLIISHLDWRAIFLINIPICLILFLGWLQVKHPCNTNTVPLPLANLTLLIILLILLSLSLNLNFTHAYTNLILTPLCCILLLIYFTYQKHSTTPLINPKLLQPKLGLLCLIRASLQTGFIIITVYSSLHLQINQQFSVIKTGLYITILMLSFATTALFIHHIIQWIIKEYILMISSTLFFIAFLLLYLPNQSFHKETLMGSFLLLGIALGLGYPTSLLLVGDTIAKDFTAEANCLLYASTAIGGALSLCFTANLIKRNAHLYPHMISNLQPPMIYASFIGLVMLLATMLYTKPSQHN